MAEVPARRRGMVWVGGAITLNAVTTRANRDPDRTAVARLTHQLDWVGPKIISPAAVVVIGLGIWITLIEDELSFSQTMIWLSLVLVGVSMVLGMGYFGPEGKRIDRMVAELGAEYPEIRRRMDRLLLLSGVDLLMLVVVVWLMVFKPGL